MNIPAHIFAILERLVEILKNEYHILIVGSLQLLLVADTQIMSEAIMLSSFMIGFDQKVFDWRYKKGFNWRYMKDFDLRYEKKLMRK